MTQPQPIAVITGGASGIGLASVRRLKEAGYFAVVLDIQPPPPESADLFIRCDVGDQVQVRSAAEAIGALPGRLCALVNSAGIGEPGGGLEELDPEVLWRVICVNLQGPLLTMKHLVPLMKAGGGGAIVNVSSIAGLTGSPGYPAYAASKGGLIALTISMARELARHQIRVNAVCPGSVPSTGFVRQQLGRDFTKAERLALLKKVPMGRSLRPEEVARTIAFLCSSDSVPITGDVLVIDGGERFSS
ncbi:SDR family NAD(P)-dependent oxidoreductase [Symbiobacterium terraclitae]|uniref:SDR family NAD(P)-dependent oxidoreductase n=1 Tax=Symbiobacterium terraclitae TaxID=557451 RepID=UPI0035B526CB